MATRKRRSLENNSSVQRQASRALLRRTLLEQLEQRQLLAAGPQLIGIQPNEGALIDTGLGANPATQLDVAPRVLTFRFDDGQAIHPDTLEGIRITRAGGDRQLGTADDIQIQPGSVLVNSPDTNEVLVRFAESLPDDRYRIEVFGFDDPAAGITGLRNTASDGSPGLLLQPREGGQRKEVREFELRLGALVESVVPQPVVRLANGTLDQRRDQVVVYFNEDLFVEADPATGQPTDRSADNPRFYQLLYTRDSARNTDDYLFLPTDVHYDPISRTSTLTFAKDLERLIRENVGDGIGGGTYRLRVGNAVNLPAGADGTQGVPTYISGDLANSVDLFFAPDASRQFVSSAVSTLRTSGAETTTVKFISKTDAQGAKWNQVRFVDSGAGGLDASVTETTNYFDIVVDLGGSSPRPTIQQLVDLLNDPNPAVNGGSAARIEAVIVSGSGSTMLGAGLPAMEPLRLLADSFTTSYDVGVLGGSQVSSLLFNETISAVPYTIDLPGGPNDPAARDLLGRSAGAFGDYINSFFSADPDNQVKLISYNFGIPGAGLTNSITAEMKQRVREALDLWSQYIGVRFVETNSDGWTIALGSPSSITAANRLTFNQLRATAVPDPTFNDGVLVLDALYQWQVGYGQDFFRTTFAGVGALLGLGVANDLPASTVMAISNAFINGTINTGAGDQLTQNPLYNQVGAEFNNRPLEPIFPGDYDVQHAEYLHGQVGSDIDLYRFEVDVTTGSNTGLVTIETFAQRLPDSSSLNTTLKLFKETQAAVETNFSIPVAPIRIEAIAPGRLGNETQIDFVRSFRTYIPPSDGLPPAQEAARVAANTAAFEVIIVQTGVNRFTVDVPFIPDLSLLSEAQRQAELDVLAKTPADMLRAIQADAFASSLVRVIDVHGDNFALLDNFAQFEPVYNLAELPFKSLVLTGGDITPIAYNDDYFGTDSRIQLQLEDGVYYVGVSASGNDQYDPVIPGTGFGGASEGDYQLFVKFEANADGRDTLRDKDSNEVGVPGTPLDGDGDGVPGGANNFWFQVRPEARQVRFDSGLTLVAGSTLSVVSGSTNITRTYQFMEIDQFNQLVAGQPALGSGRIAIRYQSSMSSAQIANLVASVLNSQTLSTQVSATIGATLDTDNVLVLSGERSLAFSSGFTGATIYGRTIFVDKTASAFPDGTTDHPFNNIASATVPSAFSATHPDDIVRIVGNGGNDGKLQTAIDNFAYQIGYSQTGGAALEDGTAMEVPKGVTVMVDAGAVFKLRNTRIGVGSSNLQIDRSGGALQVLGTPRLLSSTGQVLVNNGQVSDGSVVFTSLRDRTVAQNTPGSTLPAAGDWGGLVLRRNVDDSFGRFNLEDQGIFLNHINFADIRYGGGSNVLVDANQVTVNPIQIVDTKPTITFNRVTNSADAAMSAAPDSFEEVSYQSPRYQGAGAFTADYDRVGPDIRRNSLANNSLNGIFVRVDTLPGQDPVQQVVSGRWDDTDIVHILSENLILAGNAGGAVRDGVKPALTQLTSRVIADAGNVDPGTYRYRLTLVDGFGFESLASDPTAAITVAGADSRIALAGLPQVPANSGYQFRRLYRTNDGLTYELVAELNATDTTYIDRLSQDDATSVLDLTRVGERGRPASSLTIDPGTVVKLQGSRIEVGFGAQMLAEGTLGKEIIFTSIQDDRYGAGGSFDTNNDGQPTDPFSLPSAGDWAGIYASPSAHLSLDYSVVAFAGGLSRIEGTFKAFNPIELQQATARIVNTVFEDNADGIGGQGPTGRFGRLANMPATIFVRGSQPVIVGNTFTGNDGSVIDINVNSLNAELNPDVGRQTGSLSRIQGLDENRGPLVRRNLLENNELNGMEVRGATLTTESVWDDTDIVHMLFDSVIVDNFHGSGGLRLQSNPNESLVIKLHGPSSPFNDTTGTGFTITGTENDLADRIGGSLQVLGRPGFPVVMTSLFDDTVGAGRKPDGTQLTDTNNDAYASRPTPNDWRSVFLDQTSNDRNVKVVRELELPTDQAPGSNGQPGTAQVLGDLAGRAVEGDDLRRIAFDVEGFLSEPTDLDVYQFSGEAGTEVWIDIDRTTSSLDTVLEILDADGNVLARSTNAFDEVFDYGTIEVFTDQLTGRVGSLAKGPSETITFSTGGDYYDFDSSNPRDAGMRLILPGAVGARGPYFVRVRSNSVDKDDAAGGLTSGSYRFQVRLQEEQEFAGSSVTYADIRYANVGVHAKGLPGESPLLGDAQENELVTASLGQGIPLVSSNNSIFQGSTPAERPQYLGNLAAGNDRTLSVGGELSGRTDVDFYRIDLDSSGIGSSAGGVVAPAVFDIDYADGISRPDTNMAVFYSPSGTPAGARLVLWGTGSNIAEDTSGLLNTLSENIFHAGSTGSGDPFIGPVALPEGTYYVGITHSSRVPSALNDVNVRREPINSVTRIVEERFYLPGDTVVLTSANPPVVPQFFNPAALPAGWSINLGQSTAAGHGIPASYDASRPVTNGGRSMSYSPASGAPNTQSTVQSASFSLAGYSAADLPNLYFNYAFDGSTGDQVRLELVSGSTVTPLIASGGANGLNTSGAWRQAVVSLAGFEFQDNLSLRVVYQTGSQTTGTGFRIDDIVVGFAERGEMILGAATGNDAYTAGGNNSAINAGEYQLEVRPATTYYTTTAQLGRQIILDQSFDTNDRHAESVTIVAPAGADLQDGYHFTLGDGSKLLTFEFDELTAAQPTGNGVAFGNIRIPFRSVDSPAKVGSAMRAAINTAVVQNSLRFKATTAFGGINTSPSDERINLHGPVTGDFVSLATSTTPTPITPADPLHVQIPARFSDGLGDANAERVQGQIIIDSNYIRNSKVYGVWSDGGDRLFDPLDAKTSVVHEDSVLHSPALGAVRNLPTTNNEVVGGMAPGLVVQNNVIDQAGYVGVEIDGDMRPLVIDGILDDINPDIDLNAVAQFYFGSTIIDGLAFALDAGGTRVVFEFEDISGSSVPSPDCGDENAGGRGWQAGHVPIFYRAGNNGSDQYNITRVYPSTRTEVMHAIRDAIIGSILVTNDLVPLVDVWINDSLFWDPSQSPFSFGFGNMAQPTSTVFINGATNIYWTNAYTTACVYAGSPSGPFVDYYAPVQEAPQPFARVINNTIYGADGTEANFRGVGSQEPSDQLVTAIDTKQGQAHTVNPYTTQGVIGDASLQVLSQDVDLYRFHMEVGDRVKIDLSSLSGADLAVRLFNSEGEEQPLVNALGNVVTVLNTGQAAPQTVTIDYTALATDSYYLGISSTGNEKYDPLSFAGRVDGTGGTGSYGLSLEVLAARQFVLSLQEVRQFNDLIGTTFTVEQIADLPGQTTNARTFEFVAGGAAAAGNIPINITVSNDHTGWRTADVMRAIAGAINSSINGVPVLPNHERQNGPNGVSGPITRVEAVALGGRDGWDGNSGLSVWNGGTVNGVQFPIRTPPFGGAVDSPQGFGHDRNGQVGSGNATGTTENYVLISNAARVTMNSASPLAVDPAPGRYMDQLLSEAGVMIRKGASPSLMNNVIVNTQAAVEVEVTRTNGFGQTRGGNQHPRPGQVIVGGTIFQNTETVQTVFQSRMQWPNAQGAGTETDAANFPSNVNPIGGGTSDFNLLLPGAQTLFIDQANDNFVPASGSIAIDSSINSLAERDAFGSLKQALGLPVNPLLAPARDVTGQLRVDDPAVSFTGLGSNVFKDRGAVDRADFVGPVAVIINPFDNDSRNVDQDPNVSFVQVEQGVISEFRIQLRDSGDASDPFQGSGVDDATVVTPDAGDLHGPGAVVTLFENGRLLEEGIDYLFSYDATNDVITLRPLAGIWRQEAVYEIGINNRDRFVAVAPAGPQISDGDQFVVYDDAGGRVTFEYESGYQLLVPEVISLTIPAAGTGSGGISDGDRVSINDGIRTVTFEYTTDLASVLAGNKPVLFSLGDTAAQLVESLRAAIQAQIAAGAFNRSIPGVGIVPTVTLQIDGTDTLRVGMEAGGIVNASSSGLIQSGRTLALLAPTAPVGQPGGVRDRDSFIISDGINTVNFEFDVDGVFGGGGTVVDLVGITQPSDVVLAIERAIRSTDLRADMLVVGDNLLYLGLPDGGSATIGTGSLAAVSLAQTMTDGGTITLTPTGGTPFVVELNRTDEPGGDDGVAAGNARVNFTRTSTGDEIAAQIAAAVATNGSLGLNPTAPGSGVVSLGGNSSLALNIANEANLRVTGRPGQATNSTIRIFGALILQAPLVGGNGVADGATFSITANGVTQQFELNQQGTPVSTPGALTIDFLQADDVDTLTQKIAAAITGSPLGITASALPNGQVSLGQLPDNSVALETAGQSNFSVRRGVVNDGEILIISEEGQQLVFEFEEASNGGGITPGNIQVLFNENDTTDQVAEALAAAIRLAGVQLGISATNIGGGLVELVDTPRTRLDVSAAPTLSLEGVSGGAIPVAFVQASSFSAEDLKRAIIDAINTANERFGKFMTSLTAVDRGGNTFFIENAVSVEAPLVSYFLPAVQDVMGQDLKANREDGTTRFTLMLPTVDFDYGDAPDPQGTVLGRYPTTVASDGARHVIGVGPVLGTVVDAEPDGQPLIGASGDDAAAYVVGNPSASLVDDRQDGVLKITIDPAAVDGDVIRIGTVLGVETFELDSNDIFSEDNLPVRFAPGSSPAVIASALRAALLNSSLGFANVTAAGNVVSIVSNDDDGVMFTSPTNPFGVFNPNISTTVTVTVTGEGYVDGWVDFNADGDWDDPGEQIFVSEYFAGGTVTRTFQVPMPATAPVPTRALDTYARIRVSSQGGLRPSGLATDGEVEDYRVSIVPGSPPVINNTQRSYTVDEDQRLIGIDTNGGSTPALNDNGLLAGIVDPDGDAIAVFPTPAVETINGVDYQIIGIGVNQVTADGVAGGPAVGTLTVQPDGRFSFDPAPDYFGNVVFRVRVQDVNAGGNSSLELVAPQLLTVTFAVNPINDAPLLVNAGANTKTIADSPEDQVVTMTNADLVALFTPGPANEASQALRVQAAGYGGVANVTKLGGTLQITASGDVIYTPPTDYSGPDTDEFYYTVVDAPAAGQSPQQSSDRATVVVSFVPVNDAPIAGADTYAGVEDTPLTIAVSGANGILSNDVAGPQDEINAGQTVALVTSQFPIQTVRGGQVTLSADGQTLVYTPRANFSGADSFQYQIIDNSPLGAATALGTVTINVAGENDGAIYGGPASLTYNESKGAPQSFDIDLNTWFTDPEGDFLTFDASAANGALLQTSINGSILTITLPQDRSGNTTLTVTATNPGGALPTTANIPVTVVNTPDPPRVIASLDPTTTNEDVNVIRDLTQYFEDPDGDTLTYTVVTPAGEIDPFDRDLVQSITFNQNQMVVTLKPNASGSTDITLRVFDGTFAITETFTLVVNPVADVPVSTADAYQVAIRGRLNVSDPRSGLLANDSEADGDTFTVDLASVTQPANGSVQVNPNGTFAYVNLSNSVVGGTDTFSYRAIDKDGRGNVVNVVITFTGSTHQNPVQRMDVNADGQVSPIDALRVVNLLNRQGSASIPIRDLPAPPDYYDVDGNGVVAPLDALAIINFLNRTSGSGEGEGVDLRLATTTAWVSAGTVNLPQSNLVQPEPVAEVAPVAVSEDSAAWQIVDGHLEGAIESLACAPLQYDADERSNQSVDSALVELLEDFDWGPSQE